MTAAEYLPGKQYQKVYSGLIDYLGNIIDKIILHYGDMGDEISIYKLILEIMPDEIYNLGAQSHVKVSFNMPEYTGNVSGLGTTRLLEAIKKK